MKRFTETDKWRDPWFRKLSAEAKLAFWFVVENCDAAGVWDADFDLADFQIGKAIPWPTVLEAFGERVRTLPSGKWFLTKFVEFQYGKLSPECAPHKAVIRLLERHGITVSEGYSKGSDTLQDKTRQDKDTDKDKTPTPPHVQAKAEAVYTAYPRKEAKQTALVAIAKAAARAESQAIFTGHADAYAFLLERVQAYAAAVSRWPDEERKKYVPHPATWFNGGRYDDDPMTWERNASTAAATDNRPIKFV